MRFYVNYQILAVANTFIENRTCTQTGHLVCVRYRAVSVLFTMLMEPSVSEKLDNGTASINESISADGLMTLTAAKGLLFLQSKSFLLWNHDRWSCMTFSWNLSVPVSSITDFKMMSITCRIRITSQTFRFFNRWTVHSSSSVAYLHYTFFPASDHFLLADPESERLVSITRWVELPPVCQGACETRRWTESHRVRKKVERAANVSCGWKTRPLALNMLGIAVIAIRRVEPRQW